MKKILITGGKGFIGSALTEFFEEKGCEVYALTRKKEKKNDILWKPTEKIIESEKIEGFDAVIHLAGAGIADHLWTEKYKKRIEQSRVEGTRFLCESLLKIKEKPKVLISVSAVGYYGDRGDKKLDETSGSGQLFLSKVAEKWENASKSVENAKIRLVNPRLAVVLSPQGGMLSTILPLFRLGLGGKIGKGEQYISWIALPDLVRAFAFVVENESVEGAVNFAAPFPEKNKDFTKKLAKKLKRPAFFHLPSFFIKLFMGQQGKELLLASAKVFPEKLEKAGFSFENPKLDQCFDTIL